MIHEHGGPEVLKLEAAWPRPKAGPGEIRVKIKAIERHHVTYLTGVPAMYKMILAEKEALAQHDVSSIRYAVCGSAEVPEELLEDFGRVFRAPMAESYGLTEGGPVPIVNSRWGLKKRGSCVEDILLRHPQLRDACVVPVQHAVKGAVPFVVERTAGQTSEEDVKAFFLQNGAAYAHP